MAEISAGEAGSPLALVIRAVEGGEEEIEIPSADAVSSSEIMRFLEKSGFRVQLRDDDGRLSLTAKKVAASAARAVHAEAVKPQRPPAAAAHPSPAPALPVERAAPKRANAAQRDTGRVTLVVFGRTLGRGNPELEEMLVKNFLAGFARMDAPPESVILLNDGVRLALFDTSACDHLKDMEARGSRVLVSDFCAGHLGVTADIGVGIIANMVDIIDAIQRAEKLFYL